ncbi:MAG: LamG-like jellyroll fold domain-containing protein [Planctomycetota bacterium]|jgi:hypothetical protein
MRIRIATGVLVLCVAVTGPARGADGPVMHLRFDEPDGNQLVDSAGRGDRGTLHRFADDGSCRVQGVIGGAIEFDGVDDFCSLRPAPVSTLRGTIAFWFRSNANFKDPAFIYYGSPVRGGNGYGEQDELHVGFDERDRLTFFIMGWGLLTSRKVHTDGRWHHVAATWRVGGEMVLYVDGRRDCATHHPGRRFELSAVQQLGRPHARERHYRGLLDDFRVYDRVLSAEQVDSLRRFVSFETAASNGDESRRRVEVPVALAEAYDRPVSVAYSVAGGTGAAGVNYVRAAGTITFDPGVTRRYVPLEILADDATGVDETVVVELLNPSGAVTGRVPAHTYTINETGIVSREVLDRDGNYEVDAVKMLAGGRLNDDFSGLEVAVGGRTVAGFETGTRGDAEFHVLLVRGDAPCTGVPEARILANTSLTAGRSLIPVDTGPNPPIDSVSPHIAAVGPVAGHKAAPVGGDVTVVFGEVMNRASVESALAMTEAGGGAVRGALGWIAGDTAVFSPVRPLANMTSYTITIGTQAADIHGNTLEEQWSHSFRTGNGVSVRFPVTSAVSPACIEGACWAAAGAPPDIVADGPTGRLAATALAGGRFYLNVPLTSILNDVSVRQAGAKATEVSGRVTWLDTVIDMDPEQTVVVRRGDVLRLAADGSHRKGDRVEIDLNHNGVAFTPDLRGTAGTAVAARFAAAGEFDVRARVNGVLSGSMRAVVCAVDLPKRIACEIGRPHRMDVTVTPAARERAIHFGSADEKVLSVSSKARAGGGASVMLIPLARGTPRLVARLGDSQGAIIVHREVDEFTITSSIDGEPRGRAGVKHGVLRLKMEPRIPDMELLVEFTSNGVTINGSRHVFVSSNEFKDDGTWSAPYQQTSRTIIRYRTTASTARMKGPETQVDDEEVF